METNTKPRYICRFKDKNDCISYEWGQTKQYRPYLYTSELPFKTGDIITVRVKNTSIIYRFLITNITGNLIKNITGNEYTIELINYSLAEKGNTMYSCSNTRYFFNNYELLINGEWIPFGVEE